MKRALVIAGVLFLVVGACALYWTLATSGNAVGSAVSFFVLFFGIFGTGGVHREPAFLPLFVISWIADSLVLILIAELIDKIRARQAS